MPSPKITEGFYWVRHTNEERIPPFVAELCAGSWFVPGHEKTHDFRTMEILSERIERPVTDLQGRAILAILAILAHLLPKPAPHRASRRRVGS